MKTKILVLTTVLAAILSVTSVMAQVTSPPGCNADNSVVNIARSTASAQIGQMVWFTVSAGNPTTTDGCDVVNRYLTLTLPDGSKYTFGPFDYTNGEAVTLVGNQTYVTRKVDLLGGNNWTATVTWNGTLEDGFNNPSMGSKGVSINYIPVSLQVVKTATPALEDTYTWTISKSVTPAAWDLFDGDMGTSEYTVSVVKTLSGTLPSVSGTITITNPAIGATAHITGVSDLITPAIGAVVNCPGGLPQDLAPGEQLVCTYSASLPDTTTRTNMANVTTTGDVNGGSGEATVDFTGVVPTTVNGSIDVDDTNGGSWHFTDSGSVSYNETFDCVGANFVSNHAQYVQNNTATIRGTTQNDSASVTVDCYRLFVDKNASTTFDRKYNWNINKVGSTSELTLNPGETANVTYDVTVNVASTTDSNWAVAGTITVHNPATIAATINSAPSDSITGSINAAVNCGVTFPYMLAAGQNLICTYSAALPDGTSRTNSATATQQNYNYDIDKVATADGTKNYSGTAPVTFGTTPENKIDDCITVNDTFGGTLGTACVGIDTLPKTFHYTRQVGPYNETECGTPKNVDNTASFVTNDTAATGNSSWHVVVNVPCPQLGCTLTPGYWKTHSIFGPAAHPDATWNDILPDGPNTTFFLSGSTWYTVMLIAPKGNAYYQLSFQYVAAVLNTDAGASAPAQVTSAIANATALFNVYTPSQIAALKGSDPLRQKFLNLAGILGSYNSGIIGPGHCDDIETLPS